MVDILVGHLTELPGKPVMPLARNRPGPDLRNAIAGKRHPTAGCLDRVDRKVFSRIMHVNHPRFFGFIPSPANYVSALADFLTSGYNVFAGMWIEALGPAEIEVMT